MGSYENLVDRCARIAEIAHTTQVRKFNGESYINHPRRVASCINNDIGKSAAWLHDTLEDTKFTEGDLYDLEIPEEVVHIVKILTRNKENESYYDFIMRVINSNNVLAISIKLADLQDNISDLEEGCLKDKYRFAEHLISQKLEEEGWLRKC